MYHYNNVSGAGDILSHNVYLCYTKSSSVSPAAPPALLHTARSEFLCQLGEFVLVRVCVCYLSRMSYADSNASTTFLANPNSPTNVSFFSGGSNLPSKELLTMPISHEHTHIDGYSPFVLHS